MGSEAERIVLVCGPPGVGKSTIARALAATFERSVSIDADVVRESIVGGFEPPAFPVSDAFVRQAALQREIVVAWARRMAAEGYVPVVDDAPVPGATAFTQQYAGLVKDPRTVRVMLVADADEIRRRITERAGPHDEFLVGVVDHALAMIGEFDLDDWNVVDTTGRSIDDTVAAVTRLVR